MHGRGTAKVRKPVRRVGALRARGDRRQVAVKMAFTTKALFSETPGWRVENAW